MTSIVERPKKSGPNAVYLELAGHNPLTLRHAAGYIDGVLNSVSKRHVFLNQLNELKYGQIDRGAIKKNRPYFFGAPTCKCRWTQGRVSIVRPGTFS